VPNNSHPRHCACAISQLLVRRCLFISSVRVRVSCRVRVRLNNCHHLSRKSRILRVICQCDTGGACRADDSGSCLSEVRRFVDEALRMKEFDHANVLSLIGVALDFDNLPLVVLPFMRHGDLLSYVRDDAHVRHTTVQRIQPELFSFHRLSHASTLNATAPVSSYIACIIARNVTRMSLTRCVEIGRVGRVTRMLATVRPCISTCENGLARRYRVCNKSCLSCSWNLENDTTHGPRAACGKLNEVVGSILVTSYEDASKDASRKLLPWNLGFI